MDKRRAFADVDHVQLAIPAGGEEACRAFWGGLLGLAELPKPPVLAARGGCWFAGPGFQIHLGVEAGFRPALKAHPGFEVVWRDEVPPGIRSPGATRCQNAVHTADPFGSRLEFLEPR